MKRVRAETPNGIVTGEYAADRVLTDDAEYAVGEEARLLAPCEPSALYCTGRNYVATIEQMGYDRPSEPAFFIKPPGAVIPTNAPIPYPAFSSEVTYAGELAAVIGEECRSVAPADVPEVVGGYTIMNDVDALDQDSVTKRKAFEGSGPLGPVIETELDPADVQMRTEINGEERQAATTADMLFSPSEIIAFLSERITLRAGDVVAFGSPANPGLIEPGDEIEIQYAGIGTLRNSVAR